MGKIPRDGWSRALQKKEAENSDESTELSCFELSVLTHEMAAACQDGCEIFN